jgi:hypothetical protein
MATKKAEQPHKNTRALRALMSNHGLKDADVARITGRSKTTVAIWRCRSNERVIPAELLQLVKLTVAARAGVTA